MRRAHKPKNRLIESRAIPDFLPRNKTTQVIEDREFRIVYPDSGTLFQTVRTNELIALADQKLIAGVIDKHNFFLRAVLMVSVQAAWRVIRGLRRPVMPSLFISKPKQSRGAKHWKHRHDHAQHTGRMHGHTHVTLSPDLQGSRYARP